MCHMNCRWENFDGDCKVSSLTLPDDCLLKDDYEEEPDEFFIGDDFFTMPSIARMSGLRRIDT